jgi:hypothetical protein
MRRAATCSPGRAGTAEKPAGITDVIRSETDVIFNVTRTQLFGPDDLEKVKAIQGQYKLEPLSAFLGEEAPAASARPDFPEWDEGSQFDERFFAYLDFMMDLLGKPGPGEEALWQDLARLGIGPGRPSASMRCLHGTGAGAESRGERRVRRDRGLHCQ